MSSYYLRYPLQNGYVHHWLVAGPVEAVRESVGAVHELPLLPPDEGGSFRVGEQELTWRILRALEDHLLDLATPCDDTRFLRTWAYVELETAGSLEANLLLTSFGPAWLWLNGDLVLQQDDRASQSLQTLSRKSTLREGVNQVLVRLDQEVVRASPYGIALRLVSLDAGRIRARVPSATRRIKRRQIIEGAVDAGYIERDLYAGEEELVVKWPCDLVAQGTRNLREHIKLGIRIQTPGGQIVAEARPDVKPSFTQPMLRAYEVQDDHYVVRLMADPPEYHVGNMRVHRDHDVVLLRNTYSGTPYGNIQERAQEALQYAARRPDSIYATIARCALGVWSWVEAREIEAVIQCARERIGARRAMSLLGLLSLVYRFATHASFPTGVSQHIEECALSFRYAQDEPGRGAARRDMAHHVPIEDQAILLATCQVLASQLYPERAFSHSGHSGREQQELGEQRALAWLDERAATGFGAWDSPSHFECYVVALVHLVDLARNAALQEMAAVVLDKLLFTLAVYSFRVCFGSTHAASEAPFITDARIEPTSGMSRLLFGMGIWNPHIAATVSLACSEEYSLPAVVESIAADTPAEMCSQEHHLAGPIEAWRAMPLPPSRLQASERVSGVHKVSYKTPDYMLCSAQDHRAGERGGSEHIWQATLGPDATVFVNHPACASVREEYRPNFWRGNACLPRVAQWRDVLVALYRFPEDDWMGYTHAHFPIAAFDLYAIEQGWAFACKGEGYLALQAARDQELITSGPSAYRELRSFGAPNIWLCHMGRAALDGSFGEFQRKILALDVSIEDLAMRCATLRGDRLAFAWEGPLWVNDQPQTLHGFRHYENPYCTVDLAAPSMEITHGEWMMRLHFNRRDGS